MEATISNTSRTWFTGNQLKILGVIFMVIDHLHQMFIPQGAPDWFTYIGRLSAPLFLFMVAEGMRYTRSRTRYLLLLLAGFEFMVISSTVVSTYFFNENIILTNNIFGSLLMIGLYIVFIEMLIKAVKEKKFLKATGVILLMILPFLVGLGLILFMSNTELSSSIPSWLILIVLQFIPNPIFAEGGLLFVVLGVSIYLLRNNRVLQAAALAATGIICLISGSYVQALMGLSAIFILLYNGRKGGGNKYFFYIFYPAHIYVFYFIAYFLMNLN
ncbi:MAG: conjugal transfer protein TraX [Clostridiales bacterium]|jgi:hypothetical protein|nr:conjugal transfer protein TraX [Clostridiales bacterium]